MTFCEAFMRLAMTCTLLSNAVLLQLLDVGATVTRDYAQLKEVALFLAQPNVLPPGQGLGLYISVSGEWQARHPWQWTVASAPHL